MAHGVRAERGVGTLRRAVPGSLFFRISYFFAPLRGVVLVQTLEARCHTSHK